MPKLIVPDKLKKVLPWVGLGALALVAAFFVLRRKSEGSSDSGGATGGGVPMYPYAFGGGVGGSALGNLEAAPSTLPTGTPAAKAYKGPRFLGPPVPVDAGPTDVQTIAHSRPRPLGGSRYLTAGTSAQGGPVESAALKASNYVAPTSGAVALSGERILQTYSAHPYASRLRLSTEMSG